MQPYTEDKRDYSDGVERKLLSSELKSRPLQFLKSL